MIAASLNYSASWYIPGTMKRRTTIYFVSVVLVLLLAGGLLLGPREAEPRCAPTTAGESGQAKEACEVESRDMESGISSNRLAAAFDDEEDSELIKTTTRAVQGPASAGAVTAGNTVAAGTLPDLGERLRSELLEAQSQIAAALSPSPSPLGKKGDDEGELFTPDELAQLRVAGAVVERPGDSSLIPGISSRTDYVAPAPEPPPPSPTPSPTPEETPMPRGPRFSGQARGYVMLYMMHPAARATAEREIQTLIDSSIREVYLSVLTDGTFGKDLSYMAQVLRRLNAEQRIVTLALYLTNGPHMRAWKSTPNTAGFNKMDPLEFRASIRWNAQVRAQFVGMVEEVKPVFQLNRALHPANHNIAIVMLEDNLQEDSYVAMRELAHSVLGNLVQFVRNPCEGCYAGNDGASAGDAIELHSTQELFRLGPGDGLTLDGQGFYFPWETALDPDALSVDQLLAVQFAAYGQALRYFGLWRFERQGLVNGMMLHSDQRTYEVPTDEQAAIEADILRSGLQEIPIEEEGIEVIE